MVCLRRIVITVSFMPYSSLSFAVQPQDHRPDTPDEPGNFVAAYKKIAFPNKMCLILVSTFRLLFIFFACGGAAGAHNENKCFFFPYTILLMCRVSS